MVITSCVCNSFSRKRASKRVELVIPRLSSRQSLCRAVLGRGWMSWHLWTVCCLYTCRNCQRFCCVALLCSARESSQCRSRSIALLKMCSWHVFTRFYILRVFISLLSSRGLRIYIGLVLIYWSLHLLNEYFNMRKVFFLLFVVYVRMNSRCLRSLFAGG